MSEEFLKTNVEFALHPQSPAGFAGLAALGDAVVDGVEELRRRLRDVAPHVRLPVLHVFLALPRAQAGITSPAFFQMRDTSNCTKRDMPSCTAEVSPICKPSWKCYSEGSVLCSVSSASRPL